MNSSKLLWQHLKETGQNSIPEAETLFASVLLRLLRVSKKHQTNGLVCSALEASLDNLDRGDAVSQIIQEMREEK